MGHHYVPQRYLRNFEIPRKEGFIWLFDRRGTDVREASIEKVAQQRRFYDPDVERQLAEAIEKPGNLAIQKLLACCPITAGERRSLTLYMGTMLMRVPERRKRALESMPHLVADTRPTVLRELATAIGQHSVESAFSERILAEAERIIDSFINEPPQPFHEYLRKPWPSPRVLDAIHSMTFRVLISNGPSFFVTSDNPIFFFRSDGVGTENSELTFPLSTSHALHGSFQRIRDASAFIPVSEQIVKEMNRRIVSFATRLVFYHEKTQWLQELVQKNDFRLQRCVWY